MRTDLERAFSLANVKLAWKWTLSNSEAQFKNYFREIYAAYSVMERENLILLRDKLREGVYQPKPPCKLYFPKKSGILRPYTLLAVEDQIVYQALVNIIAERHLKKAKKGYLKQVFGHLYAGKTSNFFYRRWQDGYHAFSDAIRQTYVEGYRMTASFDLTACYDTIDHQVLGQLLHALTLDDAFVSRLIQYLQVWTQDSDLGDDALYHGHGIPQGPLPSGLLSEIILSRFDTEMSKNGVIRYFRYVDDIKLFAKDEDALRHALVDLDFVSKKIGLFPQSSKIEIHRVKKIEDEVKGISHPPEAYAVRVAKDQKAIRERLNELTRGFRISDETRFRWVLGMAKPSVTVARRLLQLLSKYPHLYKSVFRYIKQWDTIPTPIATGLLEILVKQNLYPAFSASLLDCVLGKIPPALETSFLDVVAEIVRTTPTSKIGYSELHCRAIAWLLNKNRLTFAECLGAIDSCNWWCKTEVLEHVNLDLIGRPSASHLLSLLTTDESPDVSVLAAYRLASSGLAIDASIPGNRTPDADILLKIFGVIRRSRRICGVNASLKNMVGSDPFENRSWATILGTHYEVGRGQLVEASGKLRTDPTAWINIIDTFVDLFLDCLYQHDPSLGTYPLGYQGKTLNKSTQLRTNYPILTRVFREIHDLRLESHFSHAYFGTANKPTRRIKYKEVQRLANEFRLALEEAASKW